MLFYSYFIFLQTSFHALITHSNHQPKLRAEDKYTFSKYVLYQ
ncbi:MAG: hypothetical protein Q8S84_09580 [bacterium]|nr:hypothetical protein [bacterium]